MQKSGYGDEWTQSDGSATWTHPTQSSQWITDYSWTIPTTVLPESVLAGGSSVDLTVTAQELTHDPNASICPAIGVGGDSGFTIKGQSSVGVCAQNDANGNGNPASKSNSLTVKIVPASATSEVTLHIGIQDGPSFYYYYRAASPPSRVKVSYLFRGDFSEPNRTTGIALVKLGGVGSFLLAGAIRGGFARGDKLQGSAVIELHQGHGKVRTIELRPVNATYFSQSTKVRIFYKVTRSTARCAPVGEQMTISAEEGRAGDKIYFGLCGVFYRTYQNATEAVTVKTKGVAG